MSGMSPRLPCLVSAEEQATAKQALCQVQAVVLASLDAMLDAEAEEVGCADPHARIAGHYPALLEEEDEEEEEKARRAQFHQ